MLIADEGKVRGVGDRSALRAAATVPAMTPRARARKDSPTALDTGRAARRRWCGVGRRLVIREGVGSAPLLLDPLNQDVDLLIRQRPAGGDRERRLRRPRDAG